MSDLSIFTKCDEILLLYIKYRKAHEVNLSFFSFTHFLRNKVSYYMHRSAFHMIYYRFRISFPVGRCVKSLRTKTISNKDHFVQGRPFRTKAQESLRTRILCTRWYLNFYIDTPGIISYKDHFVQRPFRTKTQESNFLRFLDFFNIYSVNLV